MATILVFKRLAFSECVPVLIGAINQVNNIKQARKKLGLRFSMPTSSAESSITKNLLAYKKAKEDRTEYFLELVKDINTEKDL